MVSGSFVNPFSPFEFSSVSTKTSEFILFSLISAPIFRRSSSLIGGTSSIIGTGAGIDDGATGSAVVTSGIGAGAGATGASGVITPAGAIKFAFGNLFISNIFLFLFFGFN